MERRGERQGEGKWISWQGLTKSPSDRKFIHLAAHAHQRSIPPYSLRPPPPPPGVFIHGDCLGDVSHLSSRGVNALLVVFIAATRSEDEAQPWRDISKGSEIFEKTPLLLRRHARVATLCTGQSGTIFLSDFVPASVFAGSALNNLARKKNK